MVEIIDKGVIVKNPKPHLYADHATMAGLVPLSEDEFLCVYQRGPAAESPDSYYAKCRSLDGGKTYVDEGPLWDKKSEEKQYSYIYGYPILMEDGTLILGGFRWDRSGPDEDVYNPETKGAVPCEILISRSIDKGRTWTLPQIIKSPEGRTGNSSSRIITLQDGRLLMPVETWKAWDDPEPPMQSSVVLFSSDKGETWDEYSVAAHDPTGHVLYWNGMFTRLQDKRIFVMYWAKDYHSGQDCNIKATWSPDEGRTWQEPYDTGIAGQMGSSIDIGRNRVLAVYNRRDLEGPGIYVSISEDGGETWPAFEEHTLIWDARGRDILGDRDREHTSIYDEGLFAFGKPDAVLLPNGQVYIGFWVTVAFVRHLRWIKLQIE
ncbi:MAG TPA: hypothetical protein DIT01_03375 [Lentisphaeria bacterium]|nr:hypothetical protein [Lentisphaeria bacterium]